MFVALVFGSRFNPGRTAGGGDVVVNRTHVFLAFVMVFEMITTACWAQAPTALQLQQSLAAGPTYNGTAYGDISALVPRSGGELAATVLTVQGGTVARSMASRGADVLNIMDYGAKCDGSTDDSAAIAATITVLRNRLVYSLPSKLVLGSGRCRFNSTVNLTGIVSYTTVIDGSQSVLECDVQASACLDAVGSAHLKWSNLHLVTGSGSATIGLQIGRVTASAACGEQRFYGPIIVGNFSQAPLYNEACESVSFFDPHFENTSTSSGTYAAIYDGANHWNEQSSFQTISWGQDVSNSFNENTTFGGTFVANGGALIWMEGASRHRFYGSYGLSSSSAPAFVLYIPHQGNSIIDLIADMHFESAPSSIFLITGTEPSPSIAGLSYSDHLCQATSSLFGLDGNVTKFTVSEFEVRVPNVYTTPVLFSQPSLVNASGTVRLPSVAWNLSSQTFSGIAEISGVTTLYSSTIPNIARVALTSAGYVIPATSGLVRFVQSATLASSTITLPSSPADGSAIQLVNYAGAVNALTFSPTVSGWTNGNALPANTGLRVRWDATSAAWYREQ